MHLYIKEQNDSIPNYSRLILIVFLMRLTFAVLRSVTEKVAYFLYGNRINLEVFRMHKSNFGWTAFDYYIPMQFPL
jgi:hypothetical protein